MAKAVRLEDIARECHVSKGLVSRALAGKYNVGDETRNEIMQKAVELGYDFAKKLNEVLLKKEEKSRKELANAQMKLQKDYEAFQKKYQAGGFLTEATLQSEQANLYKQDQELQLLDKKLTQELMIEQQKMNKQLRDTVAAFFKVYNADKRFKLILSNADYDNVLFADEALNITNDVIEQLNLRYAAQQKAK